MSESEGIHLFSNGFEWDNFEARNCDGCMKEPTCDLIAAMFMDSLTYDLPNGNVRQETADRLGYTDARVGVLGWPCKERQTTASEPVPAAVEMIRAGAAMLPGFDARSAIGGAG